MPPPRDPNSPSSKNRRRPEVMPGGWLWLVLLVLLVLVMMFFINFGQGSVVDYSDVRFLAQAGKSPTGNTVIKRVVFVGTDRLEGELQEGARDYLTGDKVDPKLDKKTREKLDVIAKKIRGTTFTCLIPESATRGGEDSVTAQLSKSNVEFARQEDSTAWIPQLLMLLLPALVLLAIFFFFLLPRFRDPLGGGFLSNYIKSPAKRYEKSNPPPNQDGKVPHRVRRSLGGEPRTPFRQLIHVARHVAHEARI